MVSSLIHKKPPGSHTGPSVKPKVVATVSSFSPGAISFENSGVRGSRANEDFNWAAQSCTMATLTTAITAIAHNHPVRLAMSPLRGFCCVLQSPADFATGNDRDGSSILIFIAVFSFALARGC